MAVNPNFTSNWFKVQRGNSNAPICGIYAKGIEQMLNIAGSVLYYMPISEYSFESISKLWGEDIDKKYLERYTLKGITEGENDNFAFNRFGVDKTSAERVIYISAKAFSEIVGRNNPNEGDFFQWTQNQIVYEVTEVSNNENIILGKEMTWKLVGIPRLVEGEWMGTDNCNSARDPIDQGTPTDAHGNTCDKNTPPIGDGNVIEDPLNVHVPGPTPHIIDDEHTIDEEAANYVLRKSWGGWG